MRRRAPRATERCASSSVPLAGLGEEPGKSVELLGGEARVLDQCVHHLFGASIEEGPHQMAERGALCLLAGHGREVDVALAVDLVAQRALVLKQRKRGPDRRVARRVREILEYVGGRG